MSDEALVLCEHRWRTMHQKRTQDCSYTPGMGPKRLAWLWYCTKCRTVEGGQFDD
jgi:hypothetical protein